MGKLKKNVLKFELMDVRKHKSHFLRPQSWSFHMNHLAEGTGGVCARERMSITLINQLQIILSADVELRCENIVRPHCLIRSNCIYERVKFISLLIIHLCVRGEVSKDCYSVTM